MHIIQNNVSKTPYLKSKCLIMKLNYRHLYTFFSLYLFWIGQASGQSVNFTQTHLAPAQSNPAMMGMSNQTNVLFNYRNQFISSGVSYESPMATVIVPWMRKQTERKGGLGITFQQDRTGSNGMFTKTGVMLSGAYNHFLGRSEKGQRHLSIGLQGAFFQQRIDVDALTSGSQWNGSVFDKGIPINENLDVNTKGFGNFNAGLMYYTADSCDNVRSFLGVTFQNINQPNLSFIEGEKFKMPIHFTALAGITVLNNDKIQIIPNARYLRNGKAQEIRAGVSAYYKMQGEESKKIGLSAWYDHNGAVALAVEMNQPKYVVGISYDMAASRPQQDLGAAAWELTVGLKFGKKCRTPKVEVPVEDYIYDTIQVEKHNIDGTDSTYTIVAKLNSKKEVIQTDTIKRDMRASTKLLIPTDEDLMIFKKVGYFFYRDDDINTATTTLLTNMVNTLKKFKGIEIEIKGHSCNIGTPEENQTLSENRAKRVQKFLVDGGIDINRIKIIGVGDKEKVMSNEMEYGRVKNRRVEFKVLKKGDEK